MKVKLTLLTVLITILIFSFTKSQPDFNGTAPGCGGSGCHTSKAGIVTAEVLSNFQVRVTVSGTTSNVAGELVDNGGNVVAVINKTSSNPFVLTAPSAGTYTVNAGYKNPSREWGSTSAVITVTGVDESLIDTNPSDFKLFNNYPNPFNPSTKIRYAIPQSAFTTLKVYSITGKEIATLINEQKTPGVYEVNFDASELSSGIYIYKLQSGSFVEAKEMVLIK